MVKIRQRFENNALDDPCRAIREQLSRLADRISPGAQIAIAVGSRGISHLPAFVKEVSDFIRRRGAQPFVVPAMGSHGGATADGQREVLRLNGIVEDTVSAPVHATMDVVEIPQGALPHRVFMDRLAYESDGVILINRIKPHTDFHGPYESGLMKMTLIGLGKLDGALTIHAFGTRGLREYIGPGARHILATEKIVGGVALVENASHNTMTVMVLRAAEIPDAEPGLLATANRNIARLPVEDIDVLVVDRMGKNISGVGIDPNVTGRMGVSDFQDGVSPRIKAMMVADLTEASHGNGIGVGLADVISRRLYAKIDLGDTYRNVVTSAFLQRGKIPVVADTDREAFDIALRSCGAIEAGQERIVRILDTMNLEEMYVSPVVAHELRSLPRIEVTGSTGPLFDTSGTLVPFETGLPRD
jgi:hypothetical protein